MVHNLRGATLGPECSVTYETQGDRMERELDNLRCRTLALRERIEELELTVGRIMDLRNVESR